ncbi:MAG: 7-carboxy-7-deazaguanine synthase QueE [Candidatus Ratteibacteria bacterium]
MLEICEIFSSIQGEGWRQGIPAVFIRFSNCNLKCEFCDTPQAFTKRMVMTEERIVQTVKEFSQKYPGIVNVVITGGEPYLQDFSKLARMLKGEKFFVSVETNGTIWRKIPADWICVSPKLQAQKIVKKGYDARFSSIASEFKYVITRKSDIAFVDRDISQIVILQPVNNNLKIARMICNEMKKIGMPNWFLRFQQHKLLKIE